MIEAKTGIVLGKKGARRVSGDTGVQSYNQAAQFEGKQSNSHQMGITYGTVKFNFDDSDDLTPEEQKFYGGQFTAMPLSQEEAARCNIPEERLILDTKG